MREVDPKTYGMIRLTDFPSGKEPLEIIREWLEILGMRCLYFDEANECAYDSITGEPLPPAPAFIVRQSDALDALAKVSLKAARYYKRAGYPKSEFFGFDPSYVEVVKTVMNKTQYQRLCMDS